MSIYFVSLSYFVRAQIVNFLPTFIVHLYLNPVSPLNSSYIFHIPAVLRQTWERQITLTNIYYVCILFQALSWLPKVHGQFYGPIWKVKLQVWHNDTATLRKVYLAR